MGAVSGFHCGGAIDAAKVNDVDLSDSKAVVILCCATLLSTPCDSCNDDRSFGNEWACIDTRLCIDESLAETK